MLILERGIGEKIVIGQNKELIITVVRCYNNGVKLGIEAPIDIPVHREEIYNKIIKEGRIVESGAKNTEEVL